MYSIYEMNMPEEHIETLAEMSLELGTYADALVECLVRYAIEHPEETKKWYREKNPKPYYEYVPYRIKESNGEDGSEGRSNGRRND